MRTAVTEGDGAYTVTNLAPGTYVVAFELSGFASKTGTVALGVAQDQDRRYRRWASPACRTVVTCPGDVGSARHLVGPDRRQRVAEEVENLPVNGRNFANLMTLATGATSRRQRRLGAASASTASRTSRTT